MEYRFQDSVGNPGVAVAVSNSGPPVLQSWLDLAILIEEIPTLLTTHQRTQGAFKGWDNSPIIADSRRRTLQIL